VWKEEKREGLYFIVWARKGKEVRAKKKKPDPVSSRRKGKLLFEEKKKGKIGRFPLAPRSIFGKKKKRKTPSEPNIIGRRGKGEESKKKNVVRPDCYF